MTQASGVVLPFQDTRLDLPQRGSHIGGERLAIDEVIPASARLLGAAIHALSQRPPRDVAIEGRLPRRPGAQGDQARIDDEGEPFGRDVEGLAARFINLSSPHSPDHQVVIVLSYTPHTL